MGYIASVLEQKGHDVKILDASLEKKDIDEVLAEIETYSPDLVGAMVYTALYAQAKEILKRVKREFPQIVTVAGGPHVTVLPEETLRDMDPDYIVVGEGEITILELVATLESQGDAGDIAGVGSIKNGVVKVNSRRDFIADLDEIPFPARHLMKIKEYDEAHAKVFPSKTAILATRGCPFDCGFCSNASLWKRKYRRRSSQSIVKEMIDIYNNFAIKYIQFSDDLFTANKAWVAELCREIVNTGIDFTWNCASRVDTLDKETMELMMDSGCRTLFVGVESGSEVILGNMNKKINIPQVIKVFQWAKELHYNAAHAFFIIGYIGETEDTVRQTIDLAKRLNPDSVAFSMATPVPGTDFQEEAAKRNLITTNDWRDYDFLTSSVCRTESLSTEDLMRLQHEAYVAFYSSRRYLWENVILKMAGAVSVSRTGRTNAIQYILRAMSNLKLFLEVLPKSVIHHFRQT